MQSIFTLRICRHKQSLRNMNFGISRACPVHTATSMDIIQTAFNTGYVCYYVGSQPVVQSKNCVTGWEPDSVCLIDSECQTLWRLWIIEGLVMCMLVCLCVQMTHWTTAVTLWPKGWQCFTQILAASLPNASLGTSQRGELGQSIVVWRVVKVMPFASTRLWLQKRLARRVCESSGSNQHEWWCETPLPPPLLQQTL